MSDFKFKVEDFFVPHEFLFATAMRPASPIEAAEIANRLLKEWIEKQPSVFANRCVYGPSRNEELPDEQFEASVYYYWSELRDECDTHKARLICIEKL